MFISTALKKIHLISGELIEYIPLKSNFETATRKSSVSYRVKHLDSIVLAGVGLDFRLNTLTIKAWSDLSKSKTIEATNKFIQVTRMRSFRVPKPVFYEYIISDDACDFILRNYYLICENIYISRDIR